jgi:hypothetical protein
MSKPEPDCPAGDHTVPIVHSKDNPLLRWARHTQTGSLTSGDSPECINSGMLWLEPHDCAGMYYLNGEPGDLWICPHCLVLWVAKSAGPLDILWEKVNLPPSHQPTDVFTTIFGHSDPEGERSEHRFRVCSCGDAFTPSHEEMSRRLNKQLNA